MTKEERSAYNRVHYAANRDKVKSAGRKYVAAHKDKTAAFNREYNLQRKYGITQEQFDAMLTAQDNTCAICGTKEPKGSSDTFHVDHCHTTKVVRGLLCPHCNVGLGHFKDTPEALRKAASYLEGFSHEH